ncbi:MAG: NUDIX hydrolase [Candidatus Paceibacterota bacterium]|jgi:8-oxo-dGTP pyrophosphatase MutT (NUDIX family)|nr:NUDIX hydrolase [Candidatus Paceibacterota bacterium]
MKLLGTLNPENATEKEISDFKERTAVRAIIFDSENRIGILYVRKHKYHKLPGGGVEDKETEYDAFKRECLEELGCNIEIIKEIGKIIEYRKMFNLKQTAICYLAKVVGEKGKPSFTQEEKDRGFEIKWLSIKEAFSLLNSDDTENKEGKLYIIPREKLFLEEVVNNH